MLVLFSPSQDLHLVMLAQLAHIRTQKAKQLVLIACLGFSLILLLLFIALRVELVNTQVLLVVPNASNVKRELMHARLQLQLVHCVHLVATLTELVLWAVRHAVKALIYLLLVVPAAQIAPLATTKNPLVLQLVPHAQRARMATKRARPLAQYALREHLV